MDSVQARDWNRYEEGMRSGDTFVDLGLAYRLDELLLIRNYVPDTSYSCDKKQSTTPPQDSGSTHVNDSLCPRLPEMQAAPTPKTGVLEGLAPTKSAQIGVTERLEVMLEAGGPASALLELAEKQVKLEANEEAKSPLLQALIQVSLGSQRVLVGQCEARVALYRWFSAHN